MPKKPIILGTQIVASSRLFEIEEVHLRYSNEQERRFERLRGKAHGAVMIIPLLDKETILLVKEYGVGLEQYYLSFPTGTIDEDEDTLEAANRELMEETGYGANKLIVLKSLSSSPSYSMRIMNVVLATELYKKRLIGDEPEEIEVVPWKLAKVTDLLQREDFNEARSIAALYMVREYLEN